MKRLIVFSAITALMTLLTGSVRAQERQPAGNDTAVADTLVVEEDAAEAADTLVVVEEEPRVKPDVLCEDTCNHIHGIDLSHYQGNVFWHIVGDETKMAYVYLKATEGGDRIDATFERNIEMAHRHGLKVGSYHFYRPRTDQKKQLQNFMSQCLPQEQDLIPMIDIESTGGLSTDVFCDSLFYFLDLVEQAYHQKPLLYTFRNFYNRHLQGKIDDYRIMLAMYTDEPPILADRDYEIWQYSAKGRIKGINGYVDKSRFMYNHTLREIRFRH